MARQPTAPEAGVLQRGNGFHTSRARFHGAPDVEAVLGFSTTGNMYGERILIAGDMTDRWNISDKMRGQGGTVTSINVFDEGNPMKQLKPGSNVFKGKKYDRVAFAMTQAFRKMEDRQALFEAGLKSVDFKNGGRMGVTALDFDNFEEHSASSKDGTVRTIGEFTTDFFKATGFDRYAGRTLETDLRVSMDDMKGLHLEVSQNDRGQGRNYWEEIRDLLVFQKEVIDSARASLPPSPIRFLLDNVAQVKTPSGKSLLQFKRDLHMLKARLIGLERMVKEVMELPQEKRPETHPPLIYRAVVTKATK